jgi:hypothetical protein
MLLGYWRGPKEGVAGRAAAFRLPFHHSVLCTSFLRTWTMGRRDLATSYPYVFFVSNVRVGLSDELGGDKVSPVDGLFADLRS